MSIATLSGRFLFPLSGATTLALFSLAVLELLWQIAVLGFMFALWPWAFYFLSFSCKGFKLYSNGLVIELVNLGPSIFLISAFSILMFSVLPK